MTLKLGRVGGREIMRYHYGTWGWAQFFALFPEQGSQQLFRQKGNVETTLSEVSVGRLGEDLPNLVCRSGHRPLSVNRLFFDELLRALGQMRVAQHHLLGLKDLAVLTVSESSLDLFELLLSPTKGGAKALVLVLDLRPVDMPVRDMDATSVDDVGRANADSRRSSVPLPDPSPAATLLAASAGNVLSAHSSPKPSATSSLSS